MKTSSACCNFCDEAIGFTSDSTISHVYHDFLFKVKIHNHMKNHKGVKLTKVRLLILKGVFKPTIRLIIFSIFALIVYPLQWLTNSLEWLQNNADDLLSDD